METGIRLRPVRTKLLDDSVKLTEHDDDKVSDDVSTLVKEPVTPAGRVFCSPIFNVHILVTLGIKTPCRIEDFKDGIRSTLLKHKRFCSIMRKGDRGELYWEPSTVNLDDHIIVTGVNDMDVSSPSCVEDYVAKLMQAPPLDMSRPLFEFHILKAKLGDAVENVVFRVHHSLGDGTSLMSLFLACTRRVDQPDSLPTLPTQVKRNEGKRKAEFWQNLFLLIWRFLLILWYTFTDVCSFVATISWMEDSRTPIKGYSGVEKMSKRLAQRTVSLDDIRSVKQAIHGTVNDVMFGMLVAGLSRYLQQQYDSDRLSISKIETGKHPFKSLKDNWNSKVTPLAHLRVRACALVNTRPSPGLHEIQDMMRGGSQARWGNDMGYVFLPVPICAYEDPLQYVYEAKSILDRKKLSWGAAFSYKSGTLLMNLTGPEMPTKLTYKCTSHTTLSFSNVIGPLEEVQFFGHPITHIIPTVSGQPQALCVHIQSYMGKVTIVVSAAEDIIPDPDTLCKYMVCALEDMKQRIITGVVNSAE